MKNRILIMSLFLLSVGLFSCTEDKEFPEITQFLGFQNSGITDLDNKVSVTIKVPESVQTVNAKYFGKTMPVTLTEIQEAGKTIKTGTLEIPKADLESLKGVGNRAYVYFVVNNDEENMSSTSIDMTSALTIKKSPKTLIYSSADSTINYEVKTKFPISQGNVKVEYIVNRKTPNATFQAYPGTYSIDGGTIKLNGKQFNVKDTVVFKITATANGQTASAETGAINILGYTFQKTKSTALKNDTSYVKTVVESLEYQEDAIKIVDDPLYPGTIDKTMIKYRSVKVLTRIDSVIKVNVTYKDKAGKDSIVVNRFPAQYLKVEYEDASATHQALDLAGAAEVFYTSNKADLILKENYIKVGPDVKLVKVAESVFAGKNVEMVKQLVQDGTAVPSTFTPEPSSYYGFSVTRDSKTTYGLIKLGAQMLQSQDVVLVYQE